MRDHFPGRLILIALAYLFLIGPGTEARPNRIAASSPALAPLASTRSAWSALPGSARAAQNNASQQAQGTEAKAINVWIVDDPWWGAWRAGVRWPRYFPREVVPAGLEAAARSMGYWLKIQIVPLRDLAGNFSRTFAAHQPPDVLVINHPDVPDGDSDPQDPLTAIAADPKVEASLVEATESLRALGGPGREYLIVGSPNYLAARALALRPPECAGDGPWTDSSGLGEFAAKAARAYLEDNPSLKNFEDRERLHTDVLNPAGRRLEAMVPCAAWGNDHLAFVQMTASYTAPKAVGWVRLIMVLRKESDAWSMLAASTDHETNTTLVRGLPSLARLISKPGSSTRATDPPSLLDPQDGEFPLPPQGLRFGDFSWYPSTSDTEVAEIAEFARNGDAQLVGIFFSGRSPATERLSAGRLPTIHGMWKWRVWSISDFGTVSLSETRAFTE